MKWQEQLQKNHTLYWFSVNFSKMHSLSFFTSIILNTMLLFCFPMSEENSVAPQDASPFSIQQYCWGHGDLITLILQMFSFFQIFASMSLLIGYFFFFSKVTIVITPLYNFFFFKKK